MLICSAIGDTDPIRRTSPSPGGHLSGNILSEAIRADRMPHLRQGRGKLLMLFDTQVNGRMGSPSVAGSTRRLSVGDEPRIVLADRATTATGKANPPLSAAVPYRDLACRD
jgi:hypothetical protein